MATPQQPVLSLSTIIPRPTIAIDGQHYELMSSDELAWLDYRGKAGTFRKAGVLMSKARRTAKEDKAIERLLVPLVQQVVKAPLPVLAKLTNAQRIQVLEVFSQLLPTTNGPVAAGASAAVPRSRRASSTKTTSASK